MARAVMCNAMRRAAFEPLYEIDPRNGGNIEVFYSGRVLAQSFGASGAGWFWWSQQPGCLPIHLPVGPFGTSFSAYRDSLGGGSVRPFGARGPTTAAAPIRSRVDT